jgi:hypothetical protein
MTHKSATAPTVALTSEPMRVNETTPRTRKMKPPISAPSIPTTRSPIRPKPWPLVNFPASHPAMTPIIRNHSQCIVPPLHLFCKHSACLYYIKVISSAHQVKVFLIPDVMMLEKNGKKVYEAIKQTEPEPPHLTPQGLFLSRLLHARSFFLHSTIVYSVGP